MAAGRWEYLRWAYLAAPRSDRALYRLVKRRRVRRVVEFGIGSIDRAARLIRVCQRYAGESPVMYAGFDWFEERPSGLPSMKLIDTHRRLKATGAEVRLMPGGPVEGVAAIANALPGVDLVLVSPEADDASLETAWFYLPRMLAAEARVLRGIREAEDDGRPADPAGVFWSGIPLADIECRARRAAPRTAA